MMCLLSSGNQFMRLRTVMMFIGIRKGERFPVCKDVVNSSAIAWYLYL